MKNKRLQHSSTAPVIVAFAGIDGSGKSSIIDRLNARFPDWTVVRKKYCSNVQRLHRIYPDIWQKAESYLTGGHAIAIRWAFAFDFMHFIENELATEYAHAPVLLCDRWTPCVLAWAHMVEPDAAAAMEQMLSNVPSPDLVVFVNTTLRTARHRIELRGVPRPDEDLTVMRKFQDSYRRLFSVEKFRVFEVENRDLDQTIKKVEAAITGIISEKQ